MPALSVRRCRPGLSNPPKQVGSLARASACEDFLRVFAPRSLPPVLNSPFPCPLASISGSDCLDQQHILPSVNLKSQNYARKHASTHTREAGLVSSNHGAPRSRHLCLGFDFYRPPTSPVLPRRPEGICDRQHGSAADEIHRPTGRRWLPGPLRSQERIHGPSGRSVRRTKPELGSHVRQPLSLFWRHLPPTAYGVIGCPDPYLDLSILPYFDLAGRGSCRKCPTCGILPCRSAGWIRWEQSSGRMPLLPSRWWFGRFRRARPRWSSAARWSSHWCGRSSAPVGRRSPGLGHWP